MAEEVKSTSDERVVNNIMRHNYRVLSETEKQQMSLLKDKGLEFIDLLHNIGHIVNPENRDDRTPQASRELSLAQTNIEQAVMWAVKHITK